MNFKFSLFTLINLFIIYNLWYFKAKSIFFILIHHDQNQIMCSIKIFDKDFRLQIKYYNFSNLRYIPKKLANKDQLILDIHHLILKFFYNEFVFFLKYS